ncbi:MAG: hypothetical protein U0354_16050 [Candidatus Sericytochromatia bacterium]
MLNLINKLYKHSIFIIIFSLIINFNLISHSHTLDNNIYRIETNFVNELSIKNNFEEIESDYELKAWQVVGQVFWGSLFTVILNTFTFLTVFGLIGLFSLLIDYNNPLSFNNQSIVETIHIISYVLINSLMVYGFGANKQISSYWFTLLGALFGTILYTVLFDLAVNIESNLRPDLQYSELSKNKIIFNITILPIFTSIIATIFYYSTQKKEEIKAEDLEKKVLNDYKEFSEKIRISNGQLTYSLVKF